MDRTAPLRPTALRPFMDDQTTAALLGPDLRPFMQLMSHLVSNSKTNRGYAEKYLQSISETYPDALCLKASRVICSPNPLMRFRATILLRQFFTPTSPFHLWPRLSAQNQFNLRDILLGALNGEMITIVSQVKSDTIAELASNLAPVTDHWPELLPFVLLSMANNNPPILVEANLRIFSRIAKQLADIFLPRILTLRSVLAMCMTHPTSLNVRVAALSASSSLVQSLPPSEDRDKLQILLSIFYPVILAAFNANEKVVVPNKVLEQLIDFAGAEPNFFRVFVQNSEIVQQILKVADDDRLVEGTRHLALEFVITLAEARKPAPGLRGILRKMPLRMRELFAILMKMLLDVEDHMACLSAPSQDQALDQSDNYTLALESLDRLAVALGGNTLVKAAADMMPAYLMDLDWKKRHAALIALSQISQGCSIEMLKNLEGVVITMLDCFQDPYLRVRWAAINALGQLLIELGPDLQGRFHDRVLPALSAAMDDFENPCIQAHATVALANFIENCNVDILIPYVDGIVGKLLLLLRQGIQRVQEVALSALAAVADASLIKFNFNKYYDKVMPHLINILTNDTDKEHRMLLAKSVECISVVGLSVGKDKFSEHTEAVMDVLMSLQSSLKSDDPVTNYVLQAWAMICKCLGDDFLPYMNFVMPHLLKSAQLEPDVGIASADSIADIRDFDELRTETITVKGKRVSFSTSILEEKATACNILLSYIQALQEHFFPWMKEVALVLAPLIKFDYHEEVRKASARAMPELLESAELAIETGIYQDHDDESYVKQMFSLVLSGLLEGIHKEQRLEVCSIIMESLKQCLQLSARLLEECQVRSIVEEIKYLFTSRDTRKGERAKRMKPEDFDAEDLELINKENENEDLILEQIGECLSTLIQTSKAAFLPFFDELSKFITPMLGSESTQKRRVSVGIFADLVGQSGDAALKYHGDCLPYFLVACNDSDQILRQSGVYGVGVCAEFGGSKFKPFISEALSKINNVIQHPNALSPDHALAYDNAVSALGKLIKFHRDSIKAKAISTWLNCLPIRNDIGEAEIVHEQLCSMVERSDRELPGQNNKHLLKIISVFTEILISKERLATEETCERMAKVLRGLKKTLPQSTLVSTLSSLNEEQQLALRAIMCIPASIPFLSDAHHHL